MHIVKLSGCFWRLIDDNNVIGTIAIRKIDDTNWIFVKFEN